MRFLVDENLPPACVVLLVSLGHEAEHVTEVGLRSAADERVWAEAASRGAVVITRDLDFPLPVSPKPAGLILLRVPDWYQTPHLVAILQGFVAKTVERDLIGQITVLEPGREPRTRDL